MWRTALVAALLLVGGGVGVAHAASGDISTFAGTTVGFSGDGGPATSAQLHIPDGVAVMADGSVLIADNENHRVRRVSPSGEISTFAGTSSGFSGDGGPATSARLSSPSGVAVAADGSVLIADTFNDRVRRVSPSGEISTVAGTGTFGFSGDGGPASVARLAAPRGVAAMADGSVLIADANNRRVRRVSPSGEISTFAGDGNPAGPSPGDGVPAATASLTFPTGVAVMADGSVLIADAVDHRVRRVSPGGIISTVAGTGTFGFSGDGGPATSAQLNVPRGVAVAADGSVLIADNGNHRVRRVSPGGIISTLAGTGTFGLSGDGGPASAAQLASPRAVAAMADGSVLITDANNHRVRRVDAGLVAPPVTAPGTVSGAVATELSIDVAPSVSLGALVPSLIGSSVSASTAVTVTSTAASASVQISDPDTSSRRGFLVNTTAGPDGTPVTYALANALQVNGPAQVPASLASGPVSVFDATLTSAGAGTYSTTRSVTFTQALGANEGLRSGTYGKTLTFSVSTMTP